MSIAASDLARLLSLIAHELRTPAVGHVWLRQDAGLGRPGPLTEAQHNALAGAAAPACSSDDLASDLSLLGRLERGERSPAATGASPRGSRPRRSRRARSTRTAESGSTPPATTM